MNNNMNNEEELALVTPKPFTVPKNDNDDCEHEDPEKARIHKENKEKINQMSKKEILEEQEKLLGTLGTNIFRGY